jgi:pyruvyltransferase
VYTPRRIVNSVRYRASRLLQAILPNGVGAFWYVNTVNFGDLITPMLLKHYGFVPFHRSLAAADILCTGSILQMAPDDYPGVILGSGIISEQRRSFPRARVLSVRGELTRESLGLPSSTPLGDPGLLASRVRSRRPDARYPLGIVPHYVDAADDRIRRIRERGGDRVLVIDVRRNPAEVFADIASCEHVLSSSLHGLIVADSYRIPGAWIVQSDKVLGKGFKFRAYHSSLSFERSASTVTGDESSGELIRATSVPSSDRLAEVQDSIDLAFRKLHDSLPHRQSSPESDDPAIHERS